MSDPADPIRFSVPSRSPADRKKKLGRGLGALLGETKREEPLANTATNDEDTNTAKSAGYAQSGLNSLPIASIEPLPGQPRQRFDDAALDELAASIAARGVIQPIIVTAKAGGKYQLVAGERRWRAAQLAEIDLVPCLVKDVADESAVAIALIENIQREDLNAMEEATALQRLMQEFSLTHQQTADAVGKSRTTVTNLLRLLTLTEPCRVMLERGDLEMGHARALLSLGNEEQTLVARTVVVNALPVRETEQLVSKHLSPVKANDKENKVDPATYLPGTTLSDTERSDSAFNFKIGANFSPNISKSYSKMLINQSLSEFYK